MASTSTLSSTITKGITLGPKYLTPFTVTSTGTIAANGQNGVYSTIAGSALFNAGAISSHKYYGVYFTQGGAVSNTSVTAQISGGYDGVKITGAAGTITNDGTIAGTNSYSTGVYLYAGVVNNSGAASSISGYYYGVDVGYNAATITNDGKITGTGSFSSGVYVSFSDSGIADVSNTSVNAIISGGNYGVNIGNSAGTVINAGTIVGTKYYGVYLQGGGVLNNSGTAALISGGHTGVGINGGAAALTNSGSIDGGSSGIYAEYGGTITNAAGAHVTGGTTGIKLNFVAATILNDGTITGTGSTGVYLGAGGLLANESSAALVSGGQFGVRASSYYTASIVNAGTIIGHSADGIALYAGGTVTNAGTISGAQYAVSLGGAGASRLIVDPGAVFTGSIAASGTGNVLEFGSSATAGTLAGLGGSVTGFTTIAFDAGADWLVAGTAAGLQNELITGFATGDTLVLDGLTTNSESFAGGTLTLFTGAGTVDLDFSGNLSLASFHITDIAAGTQIELCYLRGTEILTPEGPRPVETLRIGDEVVTRFSGVQPIKWIGLQSYAARFLAPSPAKYPVCISAGALGEGLPRQDLYVSAGHSMLLGGTLVLAKNLVNGITITQTHLPELVAYFAIELPHHDCVLAYGAWGETFADGPGLRNQFHNIADYRVRHPDYAEPCEVSLCAPRPQAGLVLDAALRDVAARATSRVSPGALRGYIEILHSTGRIEGWAQDTANPELPVLLEIFAGPTRIGTALACSYRGDLAEAGIGRGHGQFTFQAPSALLPLDLAAIQVRRAADGAEIFTTDACIRAA